MPRGVWPREHGTYVELLLPVATGVALAPGVGSALLALAAVSGFLASGPATVLMGVRGGRARVNLGGEARRWLAVLGGVVAAALAGAIPVTPASAWAAALLPSGLGAAVLLLARRGAHKSLAGELLVLAALATTLLPVAAAGGARPPALVHPTLAWLAVFALQTVTIHAVKRRGPFVPAALAAATLLLAAPALARHTLDTALPLTPLHLAAAAPPALACATLLLLRVPPRRLHAIGWTLFAADLVTLGLIVGAA